MATRKKKEINFDDCTSFFPQPAQPEQAKEFWKKELKDMQITALNPRLKLLFKKSLGWEVNYEISYLGTGSTTISGHLAIPRIRKNRPSVLILNDINQQPPGSRPFTDAGMAHLTLNPMSFSAQRFDPAHLNEGNSLYEFFIAAVRGVDFLAQHKGNNPRRIALMGSGIGAAAAVFAAAHRPENVAALVLERPGSLCLNHWIENSMFPYAAEIRTVFETSPPKLRSRMQEAIALLDPLTFADSITTPVFTTCLMTDERQPPMGIFGFFNHLRTEKVMDLYMNEAADPHGLEQRKKALQFLTEQLFRN